MDSLTRLKLEVLMITLRGTPSELALLSLQYFFHAPLPDANHDAISSDGTSQDDGNDCVERSSDVTNEDDGV